MKAKVTKDEIYKQRKHKVAGTYPSLTSKWANFTHLSDRQSEERGFDSTEMSC